MKLAIHSDLHLEGFPLHKDFLLNQDFDVLVLAGDIVSARTIDRLETVRERTEKPIIFVPGNHEYYRGEYASVNKVLEEKCNELDMFFCNKRVVNIEEYNFICCIGWSDLQAFPQFPMRDKTNEVMGISDFYVIENHTVENMLELARQDREFLHKSLYSLEGEKNIVVTHFAPTEKHGNSKFDVSPISAYFSNAWDDLIYEYDPLAWIYAHTHGHEDEGIYHTKIYTNQKGYGGENPMYYPNFIVEI